ncbi:hypothetical protein [Mycobacterium branderi]|uniref:DUF4381 domain-containing protein n=1 Tax=Mycobacterium branderi TaxID=43348 RepID=A0A7I7WAR2_9MYCO|nr:hypothetical protein [Mycobacterium branderi]MCV7232644.1 hypothetical protein [Mycobacterium branderi]ORA40801.1 hypothetical protein BST20_01155 [Mycobacterium branderi]BBZ14679.1 hypothetical protein MBRA_48740 [Mycobacterium branderi]
MPADDLLRYVSGPLPFSPWWLWAAVCLIVAVIAWLTGVFVWTMPPARLRAMPVIGGLHGRLLRWRFARSVARICGQHRSGAISARQAAAAISRTLRSFLFLATGTRAQYLHVGDIASGDLASAGPLFEALGDIQFNAESRVDVGAVGRSTEELIRSWS